MISEEEIVFKLWTYCKKVYEKFSYTYYLFSSCVFIWAYLTAGMIYCSEIYGKSWIEDPLRGWSFLKIYLGVYPNSLTWTS